MTNDRDEQIRRRAHEIWESEGRPHGRDEEHWQRACEEIEREVGTSDTEAAQMASLRGSSPDPTQPAPASGPKRDRTASNAPGAKKPSNAPARRAASDKPNSKAAKGTAKLQGNMPSELGGARGKERDTTSSPKYRHPENPELSWSGRGRRPAWIREAVEAGRSLSDFEVGA